MNDNEKKAIEEMAKVIERTEQIARDAHCGLPSPTMYAKDLYWKGYRKQNEPTLCENEIGGEWKPVMDGKYQFKDEVYEPFWKCSKCGLNSMFDEDDWFKFCPQCGAKMKDGAE